MNKQEMVPTGHGADRGIATVFARLRNEIDQLFDDFSIPVQMRRMFPLPDGTAFSPAAELKDKGDHYDLAIELPGLDDKDIQVELAEDTLRISGEKQEESEEKTADCLISERSYGKFHRRLTLPADADPDRIEAKYRHGVLKITIGKDKDSARNIRKISLS
jgi:HSP20 family protein